MAARKDFVLRGAGIVSVAGVLATGAYIVGGGGGGNTANLWVDTDGGTCTRQSSAAVYSDAGACLNPVAAWAASTSGDIIRVKAKSGGYNLPTTPNQGHFTGDKTSDTKIIGDEAGVIINTAATAGEFEMDGNHFWLENVTLSSGTTHGWSARIGGSGPDSADDVTWKDVNVKGDYFGLELYTGDRFTWDGGVFGEEGVAGLRCTGDIEPIQINGGTGHHFSDMTVWPQGGSNSACGGDGYHEEDMRIHSSNTTIERILFEDGTSVNRNAGSGKIFLSGSSVTGLVIRNVVFGPGEPSSNNAIDANVSGCSITLAYNTFYDKGQNLAGCSVTSVQNLGPSAPGVPTDGVLSAGNAAIDAGGATCASDTGGVDYLGQTRPHGSACDKGAYEYQGP